MSSNTTDTRLTRLHQLWEDIATVVPPQGRQIGYVRRKRALTEEEFFEIRQAVEDGSAIATIESSDFGFSFALVLWEPGEDIYPGASIKPKAILEVGARQVPGNNPDGNYADQKINATLSFNGGVFDMFAEIAGTPENVERARRNGLVAVRHRGYYEY